MGEMELILKVIGDFSKTIPVGSDEHAALKQAAWAVLYSYSPSRCDEFKAFAASMDLDLTPDEVSELHRRLGCEDSALDEE